MFKLSKLLPGRSLYIHEDDVGQQELLPASTAKFVGNELGEQEAFAKAHRAPDGVGWTDCYIRRDPPESISGLRIEKAALECALSPEMQVYERIETGYSTHRERMKRTCGWGTGPNLAIFASWDQDEFITHLWTRFFDSEPSAIRAATEAIAAIGQIKPLIYVDWSWSYWCGSTDSEQFRERLNEKLTMIDARSRG